MNSPHRGSSVAVLDRPPGDPEARRVDRFLEVVPRLGGRIRRKMREGASPGLSVPQFRVLRLVSREPGIGVSRVAERLGMTVTATSGLVDRLVRAGELERTVDETERRRVRLLVSPAGKARIARAQDATRAWISDELAALDGDELARLDAALDVLDRLGAGDA